MEIFDYDNILLLPRQCRVESRSECDTQVEFGPRRFRIPVVPANMKTVIDEPICQWLADTLTEMEQDLQSSISYAGGTKLMDVRRTNYVILGGDNAGEHLLM